MKERGGQKNQESGQNINCLVSETGQFFFGQKKREIDPTIGRPRDWPKPHGRPFNLPIEMKNIMKKLIPPVCKEPPPPGWPPVCEEPTVCDNQNMYVSN